MAAVLEKVQAGLPKSVRARQLSARALLTGVLLCQADGRPAHLTRVHQALLALAEADQRRLGVLEDWRCGPHMLTYRQIWHTTHLALSVLGKTAGAG